MKTEIIESRVTGKKSPETCEDGIVVTDDFVAVIDGSTSKSATQLRSDMSNGRYAMIIVSKALRSLPAHASMDQCCDHVTNAISAIYRHHGIDTSRLVEHPEERLTASAAILSIHRHEVWLVGDCQCLVNGEYHDNPKPEEERIARERAALIHDMLSHGTTDTATLQRHDTARDRIVGQIVKTCHDQNILFSVFDGFRVATDKVPVIAVPKNAEVVLATDGYPFLLPTLDQSESALATQLSTDPLCIDTFLATKGLMEGQVSFDDRGMVRVKMKDEK